MSQGNLLYLIIITGLVWTLFLISSGKLWTACAATAAVNAHGMNHSIIPTSGHVLDSPHSAHRTSPPVIRSSP
jgi:hypothetical protein